MNKDIRRKRARRNKANKDGVIVTFTEDMQKEASEKSVLMIGRKRFIFVGNIIISHKKHFYEKLKLDEDCIAALHEDIDVFNKKLEDDSIIAVFKGLDEHDKVKQIADETGVAAICMDETLFCVFNLVALASEKYNLLRCEI
jgi:hypothetical protein